MVPGLVGATSLARMRIRPVSHTWLSNGLKVPTRYAPSAHKASGVHGAAKPQHAIRHTSPWRSPRIPSLRCVFLLWIRRSVPDFQQNWDFYLAGEFGTPRLPCLSNGLQREHGFCLARPAGALHELQAWLANWVYTHSLVSNCSRASRTRPSTRASQQLWLHTFLSVGSQFLGR